MSALIKTRPTYAIMHPPAYVGERGNINPVVMSVVLSVCDSVRDNPRISGTAEARDVKFCALIEG